MHCVLALPLGGEKLPCVQALPLCRTFPKLLAHIVHMHAYRCAHAPIVKF